MTTIFQKQTCFVQNRSSSDLPAHAPYFLKSIIPERKYALTTENSEHNNLRAMYMDPNTPMMVNISSEFPKYDRNELTTDDAIAPRWVKGQNVGS